MASTNENTFGTKIDSAEKMLLHLKTFTDYVPLTPLDSIAALEKSIADTRNAGNEEATKLQTYTLLVDARQKLWNGDTNSLKKIITPINGYVKGVYGKASKEATSIGEQISKIRGVQATKPKGNANEKSVSTSQQSYASLTQAFSDLIASLKALTPAYNPPNEAIKLPKLEEKLAAIQQASGQVTTITAELDKIRKERNDLYATLKASALRIKEAIKSQYGTQSNEYGLVKGLRF